VFFWAILFLGAIKGKVIRFFMIFLGGITAKIALDQVEALFAEKELRICYLYTPRIIWREILGFQ